MKNHSISNLVIAKNDDEKQKILKIINKSYTPEERKIRMWNISKKLKSTRYLISN